MLTNVKTAVINIKDSDVRLMAFTCTTCRGNKPREIKLLATYEIELTILDDGVVRTLTLVKDVAERCAVLVGLNDA